MSQTKKVVKSLTNDILSEIVKQDVKPAYVEVSHTVETEDSIYELDLRIPSNLISTNSLREEISTWATNWQEHFEAFLADEEYSVTPQLDSVCREIIENNGNQAPTFEALITVGYIKMCVKDSLDDVTTLYMLIGSAIATEIYGVINRSISESDLKSLLSDVAKAKKD